VTIDTQSKPHTSRKNVKLLNWRIIEEGAVLDHLQGSLPDVLDGDVDKSVLGR
jgi:hypothetical protein